MRDHQGCIVTKSGSKFTNLKEMLQGQRSKSEYFRAKRQRKLKQALENASKATQGQEKAIREADIAN